MSKIFHLQSSFDNLMTLQNYILQIVWLLPDSNCISVWKEENVFNFVGHINIYMRKLRNFTKILRQNKQYTGCDLRVWSLEHKTEILPIEIQKWFV
jgi:hypothetical protein